MEDRQDTAAELQQEQEDAVELQQADNAKVETWYEHINFEDAKAFIKTNIVSAARSFIAIGYYLKHIRDNELYQEDGHATIWDFAQAEYGISKSTASRYMTMNDRFSKGGNSPSLQKRYQDFDKSKLQEMLSLTDEQLEQVTPEMRVEDIRAMKPGREKKSYDIPYFEVEGQLDFETSIPEIFPDSMKARSEADAPLPPGSFTIDVSDLLPTLEPEESVAISQQQDEQMISAPLQSPETEKVEEREAYVHEQFRLQEEYLYPFAKRVIRENKGWFMEDYMGRVANVNTSEPLLKELLGANDEGRQYNIDLEDKTVVLCLFKDRIDVHYFDSNEMLHTDGACEWFYFAAAVQAMWNEVTLKDARERAIGEKLVGAVEKEESDEAGSVAISQQESQAEEKPAVIDAEFTEINDSRDKDMTDLEIARKELERANNLLIKCLSDLPDENNIYIRGMKLKVAALASLVCDLDDIENPPPKPEQPELPILRNNDQRAAFVDAYETWPLWIETKETGERYYRYDLSDGTSMVVKVYHAMLFDYSITGLNYEERFSEGYGRNEYYILQQGKFFKDCEANRSALIEKLKEIQKKG